MAATNPAFMQRYQQPLWGRMDRALRNCFVGAATLGLALLIAVFLAPTPPPVPVTLEEVPERFARLILEKPEPVPVAAAPAEVAVMDLPEPEVAQEQAPPKPEPLPTPQPRRRVDRPKVAQNTGQQGRQKAQQDVAQNLTKVTGSLDKVLDDLSTALPAAEKASTSKSSSDGDKSKSRRRRVRSGRSSQQLTSVQGAATLAAADVSGSAIEGDGVTIASITDLEVAEGVEGSGGGSGGGSSSGGTAASGGEYRSNDSLLSVVRRYAPGIQFCYDNELKKNPGLRGKLVISITVQASGEVSNAFVVKDSLKSGAVRDCVLSQIHGWKFPAIPHGTTTFKAPFVFTPPD